MVKELSGIAEYSVARERSLTSRCSGTTLLRASRRSVDGPHEAHTPQFAHASAGGTPDNKFPGGHRSRVTPVPIPNTEVKPATADGTVGETLWESRSLPGVLGSQESLG